MSAELQQTVFEIIHELTAIPVHELSLESDLRTDMNMDSVTSLELLGMLDEEFDICIDIFEVRHVRTIRDIVVLAEAKVVR